MGECCEQSDSDAGCDQCVSVGGGLDGLGQQGSGVLQQEPAGAGFERAINASQPLPIHGSRPRAAAGEVSVVADRSRRYRHAKLIEWSIGDRRWAVTGSATLTGSALLRTPATGGNIELAVLAELTTPIWPPPTLGDDPNHEVVAPAELPTPAEPLAAAAAQRDRGSSAPASAELEGRVQGESGAGGADGVSERDGAVVDVGHAARRDPIGRQLYPADRHLPVSGRGLGWLRPHAVPAGRDPHHRVAVAVMTVPTDSTTASGHVPGARDGAQQSGPVLVDVIEVGSARRSPRAGP